MGTLLTENKALQEENKSLHDRLLRALAEAENVRRQADRTITEARQYAISEFARELLTVVDNLQRTVEAAEKQSLPARRMPLCFEGVQATLRAFLQTLERFGVRPIDAQGKPFRSQFPRSGHGGRRSVATARHGYASLGAGLHHPRQASSPRPRGGFKEIGKEIQRDAAEAAVGTGRRQRFGLSVGRPSQSIGREMDASNRESSQPATGERFGVRSLHGSGCEAGCIARGHPEGLSSARQETASGFEPRKQEGRRAVQGRLRGLRSPGRCREASALRPRRNRRLRSGAAGAAFLSRFRRRRWARLFQRRRVRGFCRCRGHHRGNLRAAGTLRQCPHARIGRSIPSHAQLPRCDQRRQAAAQAA